MSTIDNGGPAFPVGSGDMRDPVGMTLRDYFAAKAMASAFGDPLEATQAGKEYIARHAYAMADAMLSAREQP